MPNPTNQSHRPREPLPADFEPALRRLDEQIARLSDGAANAELVDRVYEASVTYLSGRVPMRLVGRGAPRRRLLVGRMALAASAALAVGLGVWVVNQPSAAPPTTNSIELASLQTALAETSVFDSLAELSDLEESWDLHSLDDLSQEFAMLVTNLEM